MNDLIFALIVTCFIAVLISAALYRRAERAERGVTMMRAILKDEQRKLLICGQERRRAEAALDFACNANVQDAVAFIGAFRRGKDLHERWPDFEPIYSSGAWLRSGLRPHHASVDTTASGEDHAVLGDVFARQHNDEEGVR